MAKKKYKVTWESNTSYVYEKVLEAMSEEDAKDIIRRNQHHIELGIGPIMENDHEAYLLFMETIEIKDDPMANRKYMESVLEEYGYTVDMIHFLLKNLDHENKLKFLGAISASGVSYDKIAEHAYGRLRDICANSVKDYDDFKTRFNLNEYDIVEALWESRDPEGMVKFYAEKSDYVYLNIRNHIVGQLEPEYFIPNFKLKTLIAPYLEELVAPQPVAIKGGDSL